jgi:hypothetical protein
MEGAKALRLEDDVKVKVALLPVGNTSLQHFKHFTDLLTGITQIELGDLDPDLLPSSGSTAFPCRAGAWRGTQMHIAYVDSIMQTSPWDTLNVSTQVMAVIGICHCAENMDLMRAWESFLVEVQHSHVLRSSLAVHCLAVHPVEGQLGMSGGQWGNTLHSITGSDPASVQAQVRAVLMQMSGEVVHGVEQLIVRCEDSSAHLITPNDGPDAKDPKLSVKRGPGRTCKRQADLCLMVGCYEDAVLRFRMAVELSRSSKDALWLAAAIQGLVTAVWCANAGGPGDAGVYGHGVDKTVEWVEVGGMKSSKSLGWCLLEAAGLYEKRKVPLLQAQALIQYARHLHHLYARHTHTSQGPVLNPAHRGGSSEVWSVISKVEDLLPGMPGPDQVMVLGAMASVCEELGWRRRLAALLYRAVRLHVNAHQWALAHDTLLIAAAHCGVDAAVLDARCVCVCVCACVRVCVCVCVRACVLAHCRGALRRRCGGSRYQELLTMGSKP